MIRSASTALAAQLEELGRDETPLGDFFLFSEYSQQNTTPTLQLDPDSPLLVTKLCSVHRCLLLKRCGQIAGLPWTLPPSMLGWMHTPTAGACQRRRPACMRPRSAASREVSPSAAWLPPKADMLPPGC